jgi:hypothetical protein
MLRCVAPFFSFLSHARTRRLKSDGPMDRLEKGLRLGVSSARLPAVLACWPLNFQLPATLDKARLAILNHFFSASFSAFSKQVRSRVTPRLCVAAAT